MGLEESRYRPGGRVTTYEFRVTVLQPEAGDPVPEAPEMPRWSSTALFQMLGGFHEWEQSLTHEQRLAVRFDLLPVESGGAPDPGG